MVEKVDATPVTRRVKITFIPGSREFGTEDRWEVVDGPRGEATIGNHDQYVGVVYGPSKGAAIEAWVRRRDQLRTEQAIRLAEQTLSETVYEDIEVSWV
jgi:hypothetical protein